MFSEQLFFRETSFMVSSKRDKIDSPQREKLLNYLEFTTYEIIWKKMTALITAHKKIKFSGFKYFFSKCGKPRTNLLKTVDLFTLTKEIFKG